MAQYTDLELSLSSVVPPAYKKGRGSDTAASEGRGVYMSSVE